MLTKDEVELFAKRERKQGWHLRGTLLDRYQKTFSEPKPEIRRLRAKKGSLLNASNAYSRILWMRALGGYLCEHLGAKAPHWEPDQPVYFLTIIDQEQVHHLRDVPWQPRGDLPTREELDELEWLGELPTEPGAIFREVYVPRGPNIQAIRRSYSRLLPRDLNY